MAANDWQVSGIYIAATGPPLSVGFATVNTVDITGSPTEGARIDVKSDPNLGHGEREFTRWFRMNEPSSRTFMRSTVPPGV